MESAAPGGRGTGVSSSGGTSTPSDSARLASRVPTLQVLCLQILADNCDKIEDLTGLSAEATGALLYLVIKRLKLDYRLSQVFLATGHEEIRTFFRDNISLEDGIMAVAADTPGSCRGGR